MHYKIQNDYISHHGILGMKWGIRRYQPYSTTGKRKSGKTGKEVGEAAKKKLSRKGRKAESERQLLRNEAIERKRQEKFEKDRFEENKQRLLTEGSATEILENLKYLSNKELAAAVGRLNSVNTLKSMSKKEVSETFEKIDSIMNKVGKVSDWGKTSIQLYNQIASVYNATEEGKKKPMSMVTNQSGDGGGKKKK